MKSRLLNVAMLILIIISMGGLFMFFGGLVGLWLPLGSACTAAVILMIRLIARW